MSVRELIHTLLGYLRSVFCAKGDKYQNESTVIEMSKFGNVMVHLDPGHASTTSGKRSSYLCSGVLPALELYEWRFNRDLVDRISYKLRDLGFCVNNVCPENDVDVKLTERANRANRVKCNNPDKRHLFVSVHANAHGNGSEWTSARGWSVFTTEGQNNSDKLAECLFEVAEKMLPEYGMTVRRDRSDGDNDWESNFTVIKNANMPAILVENMFYTNVKDTEFMLSETGKEVLSDIHVNGIVRYCEKYM